MKKLTAALLCLIMCLSLFACSAKEGENESTSPSVLSGYVFNATITAVNGTTVTVTPFEGEWVNSSCDSFTFSTASLENIGAKPGDCVRIEFTGTILETYPAQIGAVKWSLTNKNAGAASPVAPTHEPSSDNTDATDGETAEGHTSEAQPSADSPSEVGAALIISKSNVTTARLDEYYNQCFTEIFDAHKKDKPDTEQPADGWLFSSLSGIYTVSSDFNKIYKEQYGTVTLSAAESEKIAFMLQPERLFNEQNLNIHGDGELSYTLKINGIYEDGFTASINGATPQRIYVKARLDDNYCPGDFVTVTTSSCQSDSDGRMMFSAATLEPAEVETDVMVAMKPVIYLYPEEKTQVSVSVDIDGVFTHTYPASDGHWTVTALPDGTLADENRNVFPYLFWEGIFSDSAWSNNGGFCVSAADSEKFLTEKLGILGLNEAEAQAFIAFWLPRLHESAYNIISFAGEDYEEKAPLSVTPTPDTVIRVFMLYTPSEVFTKIPEQSLTSTQRTGFTVVEWGGQCI